MPGPSTELMDLSDYARIIRSRARFIAVIAVVGLIAALAWSLIRTPTYLARAKVVVPPIFNPGFAGSTSGSLLDPDLPTEAEIVRSREIAVEVKNRLLLTTPAETLVKNLRVEVLEDTDAMFIGYVSSAPAAASEVANAFATAYVENRTSFFEKPAQDALTGVETDIGNLEREQERLLKDIQRTNVPGVKEILKLQYATNSSELISLQERRSELSAQLSALNAARVVQQASTPTSPTGPSPVTGGILGLFLGGLVGIAITLIGTVVNDRVRGGDELSIHVGAPIMAIIPKVEGWRREGRPHLIVREDPSSTASEAYRTLATNLRYTASRRPLKVVTISSALPGEGKSNTAANLSVVLAETGLRVILVAGDLRRPRLHEFLGVDNGPGLGDVLSGRLDFADVLVDTGTQNLALVRSGAVPPDPVALLAGRRTASFLAEAKGLADVVICDAPPILPVADASILASVSDGLLFVHDPAISTRSALSESAQQLETAGITVIGAVYNNLDQKERSYLGYTAYPGYQTPDHIDGEPVLREGLRHELQPSAKPSSADALVMRRNQSKGSQGTAPEEPRRPAAGGGVAKRAREGRRG